MQLANPCPGLLQLRPKARRTQLQLGECLFEALHIGCEAGRALDKRRMRGTGVGRALAQLLRGLSRFEQAALRDGEALVGDTLSVFELRDRRASLVLPAVEGFAFFFGLAALARELLALLNEARQLVGRVLNLRVVADHHLLLFMV